MLEFSPRNMRVWTRLGPAGAVNFAAMDLAQHDERVLMMTADLTYLTGLGKFIETYPDRFYNFGIAEQNMLGAAAGLAKEGFIPFASSYASFLTTRCLDQIRVNMSYMELPVKLLGLTAGGGTAAYGPTHMSVEDIAVMRALPNITIFSPADCTEIMKCMIAAAEINGPVYIRLTGLMSTINTPMVYKEDYAFEAGKAVELESGKDICLIATGSMTHIAIQTAARLRQSGISCSVLNMHTIKPVDAEAVDRACAGHEMLVTLEEHSIIGGLGGAVGEHLSQKRMHPLLLRIGIQDMFPLAGDYPYFMEQCGLTVDQVTEQITRAWQAQE